LEHDEAVLFNTPAGIICAQQFGDPAGHPVFHFHGQISSRLEALYFEGAARNLGIRLIAFDRQGFGDSPVSDKTGLKYWPAAVTSIADQLGIARFGVLGVSAGAKYALATVLAVPERAAMAVLASAFGEVSTAAQLHNAAFRVKFAVSLYQLAPWLGDQVSAVAGFMVRNSVTALLQVGRHVVPATERRVLADPAVLHTAARVMRCSAASGSKGIAKEFRCITSPWNLPLDQIGVPIALWHGKEDVVAPIAMAEALAARIPGSKLQSVPNAGHVSLLVNHAERILSSCLTRE
jgi:pimeloyl-ACP methyl ester carboxylesterase